MTELHEGFLGSLALLICVAYSTLQWLGGRDKHFMGVPGRLCGRWLAPAFFSISVCGISILSNNFQAIYILSIPAYKLSTHNGYGGEIVTQKIFRRTAWAVIRSACSLPFVIPNEAWPLFLLQVFVSVVTANILGVLNPLKAPQEEGLINFSSVMFVPFMVI